MICRLTIGFQKDYGDRSASMSIACSVCVKSPEIHLAAAGAASSVRGKKTTYVRFFITLYLV